MPRVEARAVSEDDGGEATSGRAVRRLQRSRGAQGAEEPLRTPQGSRREGESP